MKLFVAAAALALAGAAYAANPIVHTWFTTDPAPMVSDDRLYVYTGHDEDGADFFWMNEWRVYSTDDMANWTDHGTVADLGDFAWADDRAWAPQAIERNGKFYLYIPAHSSLTGGMAIGVGVSDSPTGPFCDALGKPLFDDGSWDNIDPTVFIDDDGQAYLVWGNPTIHIARLNDDMISFKDEPKVIEQSVESFGAPMIRNHKDGAGYKDFYTEGPWLTKRNGHYQLIYAAGGIPEHIAYSQADSPFGPYKYMGAIMPLQDTGSFTNHSGVTDYKGHSYFFYHTGKLPGGGGFGRSVSVEEFNYNPDGTFPTIMMTEAGPVPLGNYNPYRRNQAETMAASQGVKTEPNAKTGVYVSEINNGDWTKVANIDFGSEPAKNIKVSAASALQGGVIEMRADSVAGPMLAAISVPDTGGWEEWGEFQSAVEPITGVHDIYFVFKGMKGLKLLNFDWWELSR